MAEPPGTGAVADERLLSGWGRTSPTAARVVRPETAAEVEALLAGAGPRGALARGLGRSYGDAAQNAGGTVIDMTGLDALDLGQVERGLVSAGAGASVERLTRELVPRGWMLPVVPGTRHVTLGGALAADVHGKNHHRDGSLGNHVRALTLQSPERGRLELAPAGDDGAFWATVGGMGLTGVILGATVSLRPIASAWMRVDTERADDLETALARLRALDAHRAYTVAWVDLLAPGRQLGRAVISAAEHAEPSDLPRHRRGVPFELPLRRGGLAAPPWAPAGVLRRSTLRLFNEAWFRRAPRREQGRLQPLDAFFWPLDGLEGWNRLYGRPGFVQYQLAVPDQAADTIRKVAERLARARCPSLLGVLKRFGSPAGGPLGFPIPGWTLAVDLPAGAPGLADVLDELDELVADAGGRVYLSKDGRLRPELIAAMYPRLEEWRRERERLDPRGVMRSDLGRRLGLG